MFLRAALDLRCPEISPVSERRWRPTKCVREKKQTGHNRSFPFLFKVSQKVKTVSVYKKDKWKPSYQRPLLWKEKKKLHWKDHPSEVMFVLLFASRVKLALKGIVTAVLSFLGPNWLKNGIWLLDSKDSTFLINQKDNIKWIFPGKAIGVNISLLLLLLILLLLLGKLCEQKLSMSTLWEFSNISRPNLKRLPNFFKFKSFSIIAFPSCRWQKLNLVFFLKKSWR